MTWEDSQILMKVLQDNFNFKGYLPGLDRADGHGWFCGFEPEMQIKIHKLCSCKNRKMLLTNYIKNQWGFKRQKGKGTY